ncbi:MAG: hypothetical protein GY857_12195 [Desulfobacula sp.]|nr:hypothetical protein [Desulfobacula sp.]
MHSDVQKGSDSVKIQFSQVIQDFCQYLAFQKKNRNTSIAISKKSEALMENWGKINQTPELFFFQGSENADIFIIDSGTDFFQGKSGELLSKILAAMKLTTDSVFICNAGNLKAVNEKIKIVTPRVIITLGTRAGQFLLNIKQPLEKFQGKFHEYHGIKVMPTFHPSLLLKHKKYKRQVWEDIKQVMEYTGTRYGV